jgi:hypothetical protein
MRGIETFTEGGLACRVKDEIFTWSLCPNLVGCQASLLYPTSTRMSEAVFVHNFYVASEAIWIIIPVLLHIRLVRHRFRLSIEEG